MDVAVRFAQRLLGEGDLQTADKWASQQIKRCYGAGSRSAAVFPRALLKTARIRFEKHNRRLCGFDSDRLYL